MVQVADVYGRHSLVAVHLAEDVEHRVEVNRNHVVRDDDALRLVVDGIRRFLVLLHVQIRGSLVASAAVVCAVVVLEVPGRQEEQAGGMGVQRPGPVDGCHEGLVSRRQNHLVDVDERHVLIGLSESIQTIVHCHQVYLQSKQQKIYLW